jgi:hypothetical protein
MKYSKEQEELLRQRYLANPCKDTVDSLAIELEVSTRSIVGKLSKMNIYTKTSYTPKYSNRPVSKEEIVLHLAQELDLDPERLLGLAKSQKPSLLYLEAALVKAGFIEPREE